MLLIELALLPAIVLVVWIYRQDKVEKEPKSLLRKVFLFGVLSLVEELCKMKAAKKAAWDHPAFVYIFDAIVYCVISALGFAAIENVFYCVEEGILIFFFICVIAVDIWAFKFVKKQSAEDRSLEA